MVLYAKLSLSGAKLFTSLVKFRFIALKKVTKVKFFLNKKIQNIIPSAVAEGKLNIFKVIKIANMILKKNEELTPIANAFICKDSSDR
jgi:hypothetical protein